MQKKAEKNSNNNNSFYNYNLNMTMPVVCVFDTIEYTVFIDWHKKWAVGLV